MKQLIGFTAVLMVAMVIVASLGQRLTGADFLPAAAYGAPVPTVSVNGPDLIDAAVAPVEDAPSALATADAVTAATPTSTSAPAAATTEGAAPGSDTAESLTPSTAATAAAAAAAAPVAQPAQAVAPAVVPAPPQTPAPAPTAPPAPPAPVATAAPAGCPATWFCYPRLGIAGPIVPYSDCLGTTDIGTNIRSFTCLSPFYLMGHAYTQFGQITQWRAGDVVVASGRQFVIGGAFTQNSCAAPARAIAPLSLQTSLSSGGCGSVLVVQGT